MGRSGDVEEARWISAASAMLPLCLIVPRTVLKMAVSYASRPPWSFWGMQSDTSRRMGATDKRPRAKGLDARACAWWPSLGLDKLWTWLHL
jgi:hypothetical protein